MCGGALAGAIATVGIRFSRFVEYGRKSVCVTTSFLPVFLLSWRMSLGMGPSSYIKDLFPSFSFQGCSTIP